MYVLLFQPSKIERVMELLNEFKIHVSNINNYQQVVVSGLKKEVYEQLQQLKLKAREEKLRLRAIDLKVNVAFHNPIMRPIESELRTVIENSVTGEDLAVPVLSNLNGELVEKDVWTQVENIVQVTSRPVQFLKCLGYFTRPEVLNEKQVHFYNFGGATHGIIGKFYSDFAKLNGLSEDKLDFKNVVVDDPVALLDFSDKYS
ncbi:unnamed protein product [Ambrosiozyma monospora]|uniref:Unnamed protein product n=1 Tax=Ambrosiozyma monospora TaxID=43982 RepID=A0ACB5STA8_AMBMO|nr:unnamed protein product [Ambrosiozyma monospora]